MLTGGLTDRQTDVETETDRHIGQADILTGGLTDRQAVRTASQTDVETDSHTGT